MTWLLVNPRSSLRPAWVLLIIPSGSCPGLGVFNHQSELVFKERCSFSKTSSSAFHRETNYKLPAFSLLSSLDGLDTIYCCVCSGIHHDVYHSALSPQTQLNLLQVRSLSSRSTPASHHYPLGKQRSSSTFL